MGNGYLAEGSFYECNMTQSQQWLTHQMDYTDPAWLSLTNERKFVD